MVCCSGKHFAVAGATLLPLLGMYVAWGPQYMKDLKMSTSGGKMGANFGTGKMFDAVASYYDELNMVMSVGQDVHWRNELVHNLNLQSGDQLLDLGTGTADVALTAWKSEKNITVSGIDPSSGMIARGRDKVRAIEAHRNVDLQVGDAQSMPEVSDDAIDKISMSFAIRNVPNRDKAFAEMYRVIKKQARSRLYILEFSFPSEDTWLGMAVSTFTIHAVPLLGGLMGMYDEYAYLAQSIKDFPQPEDFATVLENNKFHVIHTYAFMAGIVQLYVATPYPEQQF